MYALPFVVLSLVAFFAFLLVPRLEKYAISGLVAPVAFGSGSFIGLMLMAIASQGQSIGAFVGVSFFLCGGMGGACLGVAVVRRLEREFLKTIRAKQFVLRVVIGLIIFGLVSFVSLAAAEGLDPASDNDRVFFVMAAVSLLVGLLAGWAAYLIARKVQARKAEPSQVSNS